MCNLHKLQYTLQCVHVHKFLTGVFDVSRFQLVRSSFGMVKYRALLAKLEIMPGFRFQAICAIKLHKSGLWKNKRVMYFGLSDETRVRRSIAGETSFKVCFAIRRRLLPMRKTISGRYLSDNHLLRLINSLLSISICTGGQFSLILGERDHPLSIVSVRLETFKSSAWTSTLSNRVYQIVSARADSIETDSVQTVASLN